MTPTNEQRFVKSDPKSPDVPAPHIYWKRSALGLVCKTLFSVNIPTGYNSAHAAKIAYVQAVNFVQLSESSIYVNIVNATNINETIQLNFTKFIHLALPEENCPGTCNKSHVAILVPAFRCPLWVAF